MKSITISLHDTLDNFCKFRYNVPCRKKNKRPNTALFFQNGNEKIDKAYIKNMKRRRNDNRKTFQTLTLVTQLGLTMIVSIGVTCALGIWLDRRLGTSWITIVMFVIGTIAGCQGVYRMIQKIYGDDERDKENDSTGEDHRTFKKD